jgi:hypothetical protein
MEPQTGQPSPGLGPDLGFAFGLDDGFLLELLREFHGRVRYMFSERIRPLTRAPNTSP